MNVFEEFPEVENNADDLGDSDIEKLISVALKGKHQEVELLKSLDEYEVGRILRSANIKVSKTFTEVATGYSSIDTFKAFRTFVICADYYKIEAERVDDCLDEYKTYLSAGHWLDAFLGKEREFEDLYDFRKK